MSNAVEVVAQELKEADAGLVAAVKARDASECALAKAQKHVNDARKALTSLRRAAKALGAVAVAEDQA